MRSPSNPVDADVVAVELWHVAVPLRREFRAAHGTATVREVVVVAVALADGTVGWGECDTLAAPTYTAEWTADAYLALRDELVPEVLAGGSGRRADRPMASAALRTAVLDATLRQQGVPVRSWLGAGEGPLERTVVLGRSRDARSTIVAVGEAIAGGAQIVKLKLGDADDRAVLEAVRAAFPDAALAADANGSLDPKDVAALAAVDALGLRYLEQPLPAADLEGTAQLARILNTPIALDESIASVADLGAALDAGAVRADHRDAVNVKPARVGGLAEAVELLDAARRAGLDAFVGGMIELGVGRAAAAAVAALPECSLPTDLGPSAQYVDDDIAGPLVVDDAGRLILPGGPGIGVEADRDRLAAAAASATVVRR